jgi:nucleoside-diphosphate-sugar epimerase
MHILILGGAGMVGRKLMERLAHDGHLGGREITRVTLHDVVEAPALRSRPARRCRTSRCRGKPRSWSRSGPT